MARLQKRGRKRDEKFFKKFSNQECIFAFAANRRRPTLAAAVLHKMFLMNIAKKDFLAFSLAQALKVCLSRGDTEVDEDGESLNKNFPLCIATLLCPFVCAAVWKAKSVSGRGSFLLRKFLWD